MTYELLNEIKSSEGGPDLRIGVPNQCRFCGQSNPKKFRKVAHTFPEGLGNHWITSADECDHCNEYFSVYEDALIKAVSPFLTLGGTKGKANKVRQTGRSAGGSVLSHSRTLTGGRRISIVNRGQSIQDAVAFDQKTGCWKFFIPVAGVPFTPRHAYKALAKMGLSLLPIAEMKNFQNLVRFIRTKNDDESFPALNVGISFGTVGNAPPLVAGALLRRLEENELMPYMIFVFCAGSICGQIHLLSDTMDGPWPPSSKRSGIVWSNVLVDPQTGQGARISYGTPTQFDWSDKQSRPQPVESITITFNPSNLAGTILPTLRG